MVKEEMLDHFGHSLAPGQLYLQGNYLKLVRSKPVYWKKFSFILTFDDVLCDPDEVFDIVDVDPELSMCKDTYLELVARLF